MTTDKKVVVDVYQLDGKKDWAAYIAAGAPFVGACFKLTQGTYYDANAWAKVQRAPFVASERYGRDLFDAFYHFVDLAIPGAPQADYFARAMEKVGGEQCGTMWGMFDVERGGQRKGLVVTRTMLEDVVGSCLARYKQNTGRDGTLYGGELLRSLGVTTRLGAGRSVIALYGGHLTADVIKRTGTDADHLLSWQYRGTEPQTEAPVVKNADGTPVALPMEAPGCGVVDMAVVTLPGELDAIRSGLPEPAVLS